MSSYFLASYSLCLTAPPSALWAIRDTHARPISTITHPRRRQAPLTRHATPPPYKSIAHYQSHTRRSTRNKCCWWGWWWWCCFCCHRQGVLPPLSCKRKASAQQHRNIARTGRRSRTGDKQNQAHVLLASGVCELHGDGDHSFILQEEAATAAVTEGGEQATLRKKICCRRLPASQPKKYIHAASAAAASGALDAAPCYRRSERPAARSKNTTPLPPSSCKRK